jgi:hypothetical protein
LDFSFEIHFESKEASMDKVFHLFEIFKAIFYSKFLELRNVKFGSIKIWKNLNIFKPFEIFETVQTAPPVTVALCPRVSEPSPLLGTVRAPSTHARRPWASAGRSTTAPAPPPLCPSPSST